MNRKEKNEDKKTKEEERTPSAIWQVMGHFYPGRVIHLLDRNSLTKYPQTRLLRVILSKQIQSQHTTHSMLNITLLSPND